ncbi:hypothetical protein CFT12S00416_08960 [Campylobacter fetus subsp. testudinum]|uniref:AAA family ATPase n=3 Tax=Campylobacter fetus TaxID=196 RepID=UPI0008189AFE|nr:ATP-binding protein [Campylobacter fetus]OCR86954.1 hypothetical protein CFT12S00416_08960 [Campylobacter fetus subsp. testudinum]
MIEAFIKNVLNNIKLDPKLKTNASLWLIATDEIYYENKSLIAELLKSSVIVMPTLNEVQNELKTTDEKKVFLAPYEAFKEVINLIPQIELENKYGILTTQEAELGITKAQALQEKLGISVIDSPYTFADIGGAEKLKEYIEQLKQAEQRGFKPKGIFLVGIPGTGKTFFPTCLSGELKRPLIMLNLEQLKEAGNPINQLNKVFEFLNKQKEKMILLIDEIEKMIGNADDPLTGRLMTILSSLGDPGSEYKDLNLLIFATANNLNSILDHQPALLRRGRFDELFFVNLPTEETARNIFQIYIKKYKLEIIEALYGIDDLMADIEERYRASNSQANRFCYTPSEISSFLKRIAFIMIAKGDITRDEIQNLIRYFIPIIKTSEKGINTIIAQKELFVEI